MNFIYILMYNLELKSYVIIKISHRDCDSIVGSEQTETEWPFIQSEFLKNQILLTNLQ